VSIDEAFSAASPEGAGRAVEALLDVSVTKVELPRRKRGNPAESFRCHLEDGRTVIATCRPTATRTAFEASVLRVLRANGGRVPEVFAARGAWFVQEDLGSLRLSQKLDATSPLAAAPYLRRAAQALVRIHDAGRGAGLDDAPRAEPWEDLLAAPRDLATRSDHTIPHLDYDALEAVLDEEPADEFIKTDARPARAVVRDEEVVWFDWARCGRGRPLQDLVWLLGDEAIPEWPQLEADVRGIFVPKLSKNVERGRAFFTVYGSLHIARRLARILAHKGSGDWWLREECLDADHPIVTEHAFKLLALRGARWAAEHPRTEPLVGFFEALAL